MEHKINVWPTRNLSQMKDFCKGSSAHNLLPSPIISIFYSENFYSMDAMAFCVKFGLASLGCRTSGAVDFAVTATVLSDIVAQNIVC